MEQRLSIVTLGVSDLNLSTLFYETIFGWTKTKDSNQHISFFKLNGIILGLYPREELAKDATVSGDGSGFKGSTLAYNTRSEHEVDQIIQTLRAKAVTIIKEPQKVDWGGYSSYISDPDGHLWEIAYNPFLEMDTHGNI